MKRTIISIALVFAVIFSLSVSAFAAEPHWADTYVDACVKAGVTSGTQKSYGVSDTVSAADFMQMFKNSAANKDASILSFDAKSAAITRYEVIELVSRYITETYNHDDILQGRQKYMDIPEMLKIAEVQNIDLEHVLDFAVVYSCGIFSNKSANGTRNLTYGEAAAIFTRLMAYEEMQARNDFDEIIAFYTAHCTCALNGTHD